MIPEITSLFFESQVESRLNNLAEILENHRGLEDDHWHTTARLHDELKLLKRHVNHLRQIIAHQANSITQLTEAQEELSRLIKQIKSKAKRTTKYLANFQKDTVKGFEEIKNDKISINSQINNLSFALRNLKIKD